MDPDTPFVVALFVVFTVIYVASIALITLGLTVVFS